MWIYLLPLTIVATCIGTPVAALLLITSYFCKTKFIHVVNSDLRILFSAIPYYRWFGKITHVQIPTDKNYLIASHPHGVFCLGPLLAVHLRPQSKTLFAVAPILFHIPVFGWIAAQIGCIPATKHDIADALKHTSVILVPGGVPELITQERKQLYSNRFGMFKFNVPILTLITYSKHYDFFEIPFYDARLKFACRFNIPIQIPWFFGFKNTCLPKRVPLELKLVQFEQSSQSSYFNALKEEIGTQI